MNGRVSYCWVCELKLEFVFDVREGNLCVVLSQFNPLTLLWVFVLCTAPHPSEQKAWYHLIACRVVRLTALKLSCWLPYSWANQCCPVHITHYSTLATTAPVLHNRSREWFSQQASGPLQSSLYISRPDQAERMGNFIRDRLTSPQCIVLTTLNGQQPNRIDFYIQGDHLLDAGEVSQEDFSILLSLDSSDGETFPKKVFS